MIDPNTIQELLVAMSWVTPLVIGVVAVLRATFNLPDRFMPLCSTLVGVGAGLLVVGVSAVGGVVGVIIGLSASGLYDVGKKTVLNV